MMDTNNPNLPVYELKIDDTDGSEVNFISLVKNPAIDINFFAFDNEGAKKKFCFKIQDSSKQKLAGPLMVPDMPIYRKDPDSGNEYYVKMSHETIEKAQEKFMFSAYNKNINQNHSDVVLNSCLLENWIIEDPMRDKSTKYGFSNLPKGTWFGIVKIKDKEYWDAYIKTGEFSEGINGPGGAGFSVEGLFTYGDQLGIKRKFLSDKNSENTDEYWTKLADLIIKMGQN